LAIPEDWLACLRWSLRTPEGSPKYGRDPRSRHSIYCISRFLVFELLTDERERKRRDAIDAMFSP